MRPRAVTSAVIAVLGAVAFAAGVAWPRDPLTAPTRAGAAAPAPSPVSKPTSSAPASPTATATTPGNTPSTVESPAPTNGPPPPVPGWTLVDYDNFDGTKLSGKRW